MWIAFAVARYALINECNGTYDLASSVAKHHGATSTVYDIPGVGMLKRSNGRFAAFAPFEREVCVLHKLQRFDWAPKLVCVGANYFVTSKVGTRRYEHELPVTYHSQISTIVRNMRSVGVRHNDMQKPGTNDVVIDDAGRVALTDFGWASVGGMLNITCRVGTRTLSAPNARVRNKVLDAGFENADETKHTVPRKSFKVGGRRLFKAYLNNGRRVGTGSQKEEPSVQRRDGGFRVAGYHDFFVTADGSVRIGSHHHDKYVYVQAMLSRIYTVGSSFLDVGSNTGLVSFQAHNIGFNPVVALDHDTAAIDVVNTISRALKLAVTGQKFTFGDEQLPVADVVFAGALIHWVYCLTSAYKGRFDRILKEFVAAARKYLIIEWVAPGDSALDSFKHTSRCGSVESATRYDTQSFETALRSVATIVEQKTFSHRTLYRVVRL